MTRTGVCCISRKYRGIQLHNHPHHSHWKANCALACPTGLQRGHFSENTTRAVTGRIYSRCTMRAKSNKSPVAGQNARPVRRHRIMMTPPMQATQRASGIMVHDSARRPTQAVPPVMRRSDTGTNEGSNTDDSPCRIVLTSGPSTSGHRLQKGGCMYTKASKAIARPRSHG